MNATRLIYRDGLEAVAVAPCSFTWYIAISAFLINASASAPSPG